jgi:peptidoglycan-associated lipoprotein
MMKLRHVAVLGLGTLALGACKKKAPPVAPPPAEAPVDSAAIRAAEQARADSIAAAQRAAAEREAAARAHAAAIARVREDLASAVYFDYDSDALSDQAQEKLRAKAEILRTNPSISLRIEGNADQRGTEEYNLALGQRRAQSVKNFIVQYGVAPERLTIISYGEERPAVQGETEAAYAQNRRAEFVVTGGEITNLPNGA